MTRFAIITIELPLDGGNMGDAHTLADIISEKALSHYELDDGRPYGRVCSVRLEDRRLGTIGRERAQAILDGRGAN